MRLVVLTLALVAAGCVDQPKPDEVKPGGRTSGGTVSFYVRDGKTGECLFISMWDRTHQVTQVKDEVCSGVR